MNAALTSFDMRCTSSNDPYLDELRLACGSLCFHPESIAFHGFRLTGVFVFLLPFFCLHVIGNFLQVSCLQSVPLYQPLQHWSEYSFWIAFLFNMTFADTSQLNCLSSAARILICNVGASSPLETFVLQSGKMLNYSNVLGHFKLLVREVKSTPITQFQFKNFNWKNEGVIYVGKSDLCWTKYRMFAFCVLWT